MKKLMAVALVWLALVVGHSAQAGTVTYVYSDPQGTPLAEADASGNITATFDYRPYGGQALGSLKDGPGYTGHVNDADSGFVYMQARYYDPAVGRFLSVDPILPSGGEPGTFGRYLYADDEPIGNADPSGQSCENNEGPCSDSERRQPPPPPPVPPQVQRMRDTSDCNGCVRPSTDSYVQAFSGSSDSGGQGGKSTGAIAAAVLSPIFKLPGGRNIFRDTLAKKGMKWLDDQASKALLKKLSMRTLTIGKSGLAEATPWTFFIGAMIHTDELGGCGRDGVCADELPVNERPPMVSGGEH